MKTNAVLSAVRSQIATQHPDTFEKLQVIDGSPTDYLRRTTKGLQCFVSFRSEKPVKRDAAGAHYLRGQVVAVTVIKTLGGRSREEDEQENLNDIMDALLDTVIDPQENSKWWGPDPYIAGIGPNGINALSSPNGDFSGRDLLFSVLVK